MDDADAMMMDLLFASHKQELLMLLLTAVKQEPVDEEEEEKPVLCNAQSSSNPANLLPPKVRAQIEKTLSELLSQVKGVMVTSSAVAAMVDSLFGNHRQILLLSLQTAALEAEKNAHNQNNSVARSSLAANSLPHLFPPHVEAIIENTFTELLAQVKTAMKPAAPPMINNNNNNNNNSPNKASQNSDRSRKRTLMIDLTKEVDNDDDQKVKLEPAVKKVKLRLTPKTKKEQEKEAAKIAKQKEAARKKQEREEDRALKKAEATLRKREKEAEKAKKAQEAARKKREKEAAKIKKEREAARKKREKEAAKAAKAAKKKKDKPSVKEVNKKVKAAAVVKDEVKEEEEEEEQVEVRLPNGTTFPRKFGPVSTECRLVSKHGRCRIANCEGRHDSNGAAVHLARRHLGVHPYRCVFDRRRRCTFSANYRTGVVQHVLEEHLAGAAQLTGDRVADRRLARSFCQVIPLAELQRAK